MTVKKLIEMLNLEIISEGADLNNEIKGCFAGDLLSLAMSSVNFSDAWITVQTNVNILGIASLTEASCVIVAHNMNIAQSVVDQAREEKICLLRSDKTVYELCCLIGEMI